MDGTSQKIPRKAFFKAYIMLSTQLDRTSVEHSTQQQKNAQAFFSSAQTERGIFLPLHDEMGNETLPRSSVSKLLSASPAYKHNQVFKLKTPACETESRNC